MKKFWVLLLSLGLIMAFAMPAAAVDVKFSGQFYAQGFYVDNNSLLDKNEPAAGGGWVAAPGTTAAKQSMNQRGAAALYSQRLRVQTEFQVVEGLKLVTRFDALERVWGSQNWTGVGDTQLRKAMIATEVNQSTLGANPQASVTNAQENIEWERAYLDFNVPFGKFEVGYQQFMMWGTDFLNTPLTAAGIKYSVKLGDVYIGAAIEKRKDFAGSYSGNQPTGTSNIGRANDGDHDVYDLGAIYKFKQGEAGILWQYGRQAWNKPDVYNSVNSNARYITTLNIFLPYTKLNFGRAFIEAEGLYGTGSLQAWEPPVYGGNTQQNVSATQMGLFLHGKYDFKPAYVGAQFVYLSGDDMEQADKATGGLTQSLLAGYGFDRTLMLWNSNYMDSGFTNLGNIPNGGTVANPRTGQAFEPNKFMDNCWFYQIYAGFKPMPKLDLRLAWSTATADKKPRQAVGAVTAANLEYVSNKYGSELDFTANYKIYDNLTYMIGAGYLWTGDYFKAFNNANTVKDNYILTHKLTLNF